tara:strand:+ start:32932 stop:34002 length:1071 start_codon:yes stop_codon:yes gene_type:complete
MIRILEMESSKGWGGQELRTERLNQNLSKEIFQVQFAVPKDSIFFSKKNECLEKFHPIPLSQAYDLYSLAKLIKIIKKNRIQILSTHSGKDGWLGALAGKITNTPVVRTRHLQTPIKGAISYNMCDKVVCVSDYVKEYLKICGVENKKLQTIHTGIDTKKFRLEKTKIIHQELSLDSNIILIGIVAVMRQAKRHIDLLEAIRHMENKDKVHLVVIGDGPQRRNIHDFIKDNNLQKNVSILGNRQDIKEILSSLDIFVLPSEMEALGTSILEASASGIPIIASNIGGIPECVKDKKTGLLFKAKDTVSLRNNLEILSKNKALREELGLAGENYISKNFSIEAMVRKTENLYLSLIKE